MNLHTYSEAFQNAIQVVSNKLNIAPEFIEKDYWISLVLKRLSESKYVDSVVFKGGTSLSKGHKLINRFSEDIDIAVIISSDITGNQVKTLIRTVEKEITVDLEEFYVEGVTSKGSRFRKAVYEYPEIPLIDTESWFSNTLIIEINSFANPKPYLKINIQSMIGEYLQNNNQLDLVKKYGLEPFNLNVLDKKQTLIEKLVSLIRFSFANNSVESISEKIRHFYDLYYLLNDEVCRDYVNSKQFVNALKEVIEHDRKQFDEPDGWNKRKIQESPLIKDFDTMWSKLNYVYTSELSTLAFVKIPDEKDVVAKFRELITIVKGLNE